MSYSETAHFATLPRTTRGSPIVLGGDPKGKNFLYTNGNSVIIRDINNPALCDVYTQHAVQTTVAKYSPSGFYIASGDVSGKIRIWDTTQAEHILKAEYQPLGGAIKDIAWSEDSKRLVVGGEGREKFGHAFMMDTGASVGDIMGQSKSVNSVDFRPKRPYRVVTASEDTTLAFYQGPPFRFQHTNTEHQRFVNCVRYSPTGDVYLSGGAEGKSFIYDGTSGELKGELGSPAHKGGIYGMSFKEDGTQVLTVSGDKTAKIWDVGTASVVTEFNMGNTVDDMQVGCLWQGNNILSVSLSGYINYLDPNKPSSPLRIIKGHNKQISALAVTEDKTHAFTGSSDGKQFKWNLATGESEDMEGKGHSNQVQDLAISGDTLVSCGMDDTLIFSSVETRQIRDKIKMPSQPRAVALSSGGLVLVACVNDVVVMRGPNIVYTQKADYEPLSIAVHPGQSEVAVGGEKQALHIYSMNADTLQEVKTISVHQGLVTDVQYSPDGACLAAVDSNKKLATYKLPDYECSSHAGWGLHAARVNAVRWSPDSQHMVSSALDTHVIVWNPENVMNSLQIKAAHTMSNVSRVEWLDNNRLITTAHDGCIKQWTVKH